MPDIHSIILAAGLSTRMGSTHNTNKVCFELWKKPVICRAIEAIEEAGITSHTAVIGARAEAVLECLVNQYSNVSFAYQPRRIGPADALRCAVESLPGFLNEETLLLVTPGHRIVAASVVRDLLELYKSSNFGVVGAELVDDKGVRKQDLSIYLGTLRDIRAGIKALFAKHPVDGSEELPLGLLAEEINGSAAGYMLKVTDFALVPGFNNPEEFLQVTALLQRRQGLDQSLPQASEYHSCAQWLKGLDEAGSNLNKVLNKLYGGDTALIERQRSSIKALLQAAESAWGADELITVIRSPGRVNVMGRHVDHQGGNCNLMTIGYETLMTARRRNDDKVTLSNLNAEFPSAEFSIGELVRDLPWDDWQTLVASKKLAKLLKQYGVSWSDYIKAVFLRFQKHFYNHKLCGMDIIVSGNVPMAAGLSSSSTLVVGAAEAVVGANRLDLEPDKLVTLCGEGEWFVGTRGGAADHAAVKMGECNKVVKVGFFDFKVEKMVRFPEEYALIVADSGIKARKSSNAKDQFNHRVSCYRIGLLLLKKLFPQYASRLQHLRDFNCANLGIPLEWFYKLLKELPESATRAELEAMLPEADLEQFWNNHAEPADKLYNIRGVVLYGLAECARSARYVECLEKGAMDEVGKMMNISHDGDRVMCFAPDGSEIGEYNFDSSDEALDKLIKQLKSGDAEAIEQAQLWRMPGSYRCSLPEIDRMKDLACGVKGVVGAQLAGAGLGGCMMVLLHRSAIDDLNAVLSRNYYEPRGIEPKLLQCRPIAGAGAIKFEA